MDNRQQLHNKKNVLFLRGLGDDGYVKITKIINNNQPVYDTEGNSNIYGNIDYEQVSKQLITLDANPLQDISYADCHLVFNQIANADTHNITLTKANKLIQTLNANPDNRKVDCINHPLNIIKTARDKLHHNLSAITGVSATECVRVSRLSARQITNTITELGWPFPVIIRHCSDHDSRYMTKLDKADDVDELPYTFFESDCYLIRYVDYSNDQDLFRKLRIVVVDGEFSLQHVLYSNHWKVSENSQDYMRNNSWLFDHKKRFIESFNHDIKPAIAETIRNIDNNISLDYYAIDCALDDDFKLLIFEISPQVNIMTNADQQANTWSSNNSLVKSQISNMIESRLAMTTG